MRNPNKKMNILLIIGIFLCIYSTISDLVPYETTSSPFILYQQGMAGICSGIAGLVGGVFIIFSLTKSYRESRVSRVVCPNCGAVLHKKEDKYCWECPS